MSFQLVITIFRKDATAFLIGKLSRTTFESPLNDKYPLKTTSYGACELVTEALDSGVDHPIVGIGGSAANDAGAGEVAPLKEFLFSRF